MRENAFKVVDNPVDVARIMEDYLFRWAEQKPQFIAGVNVGRLTYEGVRPLGRITDKADTIHYDLTNSDSAYTQPIGTVKLQDIKYPELLRRS